VLFIEQFAGGTYERRLLVFGVFLEHALIVVLSFCSSNSTNEQNSYPTE
jgi:hypothetical protein